MRKIYSLFLFIFLGFLSKADAQIIIRNGSVDTCGGIFLDDGGDNGTYRNNRDYVFTICSNQAGKSHIALGFNMLDIGDGDELAMYDGNSTSAPLLATSLAIGSTQNAIVQTTIANRTGCMTIRFRARSRLFGNLIFKGWSANILCIPACQSMTAVLEPTTPPIVPADTGWITACPNLTRVNFKAKGVYAQNGYRYTQNDTLNKFEWNFGDGSAIAYGTDVTHVFDKSGGYNVHLTITDTLGCQNNNYIKQRVKVSPRPTFNIANLPSQVCAGTEIKLRAKATGIDASYQVSVGSNAGNFNVGGVRSGRLFIPDIPSQEYRTSIRFTDFAPGQTLTNINDLLSIFVDMEHSWARDLEIKIVCPSQQNAILHKYEVAPA